MIRFFKFVYGCRHNGPTAGGLIPNGDDRLTTHAKIAAQIFSLLTLLSMLSFTLSAEEPVFHFKSETILSAFEWETDQGASQQVIPVYDYMQLDYGHIETKGLSLHLHGWLRADTGDGGYYDEDTDGELLYGYVEYMPPSNGFNLKIGRQHIFSGIINDSIDGIGIQGMVNSRVAVEFSGGVPVALDEENGRSGDSFLGGRAALFAGRFSEIGLSYKKITDDGETVENIAALDTSLGFETRLMLHGISSWNIETNQWREHSYEAALTLESLLLKPVYQSYRFEDYFTEDNTDFHPFRFLQKTKEKLVIIGADVVRQQNPGFDAGIRFKQYDYDQRNETSRYMAVILNFYANDATRYGLEGGIMDGESSENRYRLGRGYLFWSGPFGAAESWFMSSDILFIQYNEDIYGKDHSWFVSLGGGKHLLEDTLQLAVSGDYSSDPYYDKDVRLTVVLKYAY